MDEMKTWREACVYIGAAGAAMVEIVEGTRARALALLLVVLIVAQVNIILTREAIATVDQSFSTIAFLAGLTF
jgi:hypothetical protein